MSLLGIDKDILRSKKGVWTATEILQQPEMILETQKILETNREIMGAFLDPVLAQNDLRIIFTGAGTSAFVGDCLAPILSQSLNRRCEAISTTDLVSAPFSYLNADTPTLLVSFARSGNSPESVAALDIADKIVKNIQHFIITCNVNGQLNKRFANSDNALAILLPEKTHDKSFAMTSSFTSMLFAALSSFSKPKMMNGSTNDIANAAKYVLDMYSNKLKEMASEGFERVVYLGSHSFKGIAQESALKLLELTDGDVVAVFDSPMGFRHGPKTIVNEKTLVVVFLSNDPYTRQYDLDLLSEIKSDGVARVIAVSAQPIDGNKGDNIILQNMEKAHDLELLIPFLVGPQVFAFYQSLQLGYSPDNPDTSGMVNRVVKGVTIHSVS